MGTPRTLEATHAAKPASGPKFRLPLQLPESTKLIVTLVLVGLVLFLRKSAVFLNPQLFAEDACFFTDAFAQGPSAILKPFVGYHHFALRIIAEFAAHFDPLFAPALYIGGSTVALLAVAAACFSSRIDLPCRPALALSIVLVPHTSEVFANLATLNFIMGLGVILLLLAADPITPRQWLADVTSLCVTGLSGPFIVLWSPLFLWRAMERKTRTSWVIFALATALAGAHIAGRFMAPENQFPGWSAWILWLEVPWQRTITNLLLPSAWSARLPTILLIGIGAAFTAFAIWSTHTAKSGRNQRWVLLIAAALVVAPVLYKFRGDLSLIYRNQDGDRYFYIPKVLLLWFVLHEITSSGARRVIACICVFCALISSASTFRWKEHYIDYRWPEYAAKIRAGEAVVVPINPDDFTMPLPARAHRRR